MKKITIAISLSLLLVYIVSCSHQSNSKLILGSWTANFPKENTSINISFVDNHTAIITTSMDRNSHSDTMEYKLSDDNKKLITKEKDGLIEELAIIELSKTDLLLFKKVDTLHLKRN